MDFEPAVGLEEGVAGADVRGPGCHAGDEETTEDEIHAARGDFRVFGAEEVMVVSVDECYVVWLSGVWRDGGKVNAVDLSRGKLASEMTGHSACAAAHVKHTGRVFDWRMEDFAHHDFLNKFMLAVESLMFGCADVY